MIPDGRRIRPFRAGRGGERRTFQSGVLGRAAPGRSERSPSAYRRDQTASALHRKLVEIRRLLSSALGPRRTAELAGIEGSTAKPSQSALLLLQADAFLKLLRDSRRLAIPQADRYFDPAAVAGALEPLAAACRETCGRLDQTRKASAATLEARDRARTELRRALRCVAGILVGWLLLIGRKDLGEKLHVIRRLGKARKA